MAVHSLVETRHLRVLLCAFSVLAANCLPAFAEEPRKLAVFPFELTIERQMSGEIMPPTASEAEVARLVLLDNKLNELFDASGNFSRVDLSKLTDKIKSAAPINDCNGCDIDLAKEAGADTLVLAQVRKSTETLLTITIVVKDIESGKLIKGGAVSIRENNDAGWLRAVRSIMRNRIIKK